MLTSQRFHLYLLALLFGLSSLSPLSLHAQDPCFSDFPTITGEVNYDTEWIPTWAITNPLEMAQDTCEPIGLTGGTGPFTWSVQGSGFWFDEAHW